MSELVKRDGGAGLVTVERTRPATTYVPRFDILETDDELTLFGDLPGVASDGVELRFDKNQLTIYGKVAPRHENHQYLYGEYGIGDYYREFQINEEIDAERISAELKQGVLAVHLPKVEAAKPRRIEVKSN